MTLKKVKALHGFDNGCVLRVSRSGSVMVGCDVAGRVWDTRTWKVIAELDDVAGEDGGVAACDLSPDGRLLAVGNSFSTTQVFDTRTGKRVARLSQPKEGIVNSADHVAFSPDGRLLACAKHRKLDVFRASDWQPAWAHPGHPPQIAALAFTPDGAMLATASGKSVVFWGTADGKRKLELVGHKKLVHGAAMPADGSFVATPSEDGLVILWELPSGKRYAEYAGHEDKVFAVAVSPDGRTAASSDYNDEFHLWDTATRRLIGKVTEGNYEQMTFSPDGKFLAVPGGAGYADSLRLINTRDGKVVAKVKDGESVAFVGRRMAVSQGRNVVVWELAKQASRRPGDD